MKWVGLTGGIATGKSTVAKILRDLGLPVVDADLLARQAAAKGSAGLNEIVATFGPEVLSMDGELDRKKLGAIVFNDPQRRTQLETILHPRIQELRATERRRIEESGATLAFYDVPLLFEKNMEPEFDATVLVYCKPDEQRHRMKDRDQLNDAQVDARLRSQLPIDEKVKRANYVIFNQSSLSDLKLNVTTVVNELQKG